MPAALPRCTRDASDVGDACRVGSGITLEVGPTGAIAVTEAITGPTAGREVASTDLAIAVHCANTVSMQCTSVHELRDCLHWASLSGESFPLLSRACCRAKMWSYSLFRMAWSHITRSA